jgi:hypothetical protein
MLPLSLLEIKPSHRPLVTTPEKVPERAEEKPVTLQQRMVQSCVNSRGRCNPARIFYLPSFLSGGLALKGNT